ncbi:MAG: energy-coupling factor transporter transmembrane protein EcfT [Acidobacteriota bacterium]|nr:energy-coupling factor transporter transmembrane protein EcfT [Acidobacteriota bacterium]
MTRRAAGSADEREPYRPPQLNLLREVKVDSPVHRLWAGTKILAVAGLSITLSYFPNWTTIGLVSALVLATVLVARIPAGAWPRPPRLFWMVILVTGGLASVAGGSPHLSVGPVHLGFGGIDAYTRFVMVGAVLLIAAALLGWTTPLGEIAPAMKRLLSPLALIRVPVDELAVAVALCVRSLPLLVGEMRTLLAARRLRPAPERPGRGDVERWLDEIVDLMVAAVAVSVRRAGELAEAITARGGTGRIAARAGRPGPADAIALVITAGVCLAATSLPG